MRKILMRGAISPLEIPPNYIQDIMVYDSIGSNSGNILYLNSVIRTLLTEDTEIVMDNYDIELNRVEDDDIDRINEEYDAYVIPLADAFRLDFIGKFNAFSSFLRKLKIPCCILGVGIRGADDEPDIAADAQLNKAVKNFIAAALEKSAMIGLRGEMTGDYLKSLGFRPEVDYTVIGCPSMYTYGKHLTQRELTLNEQSKISVNFGTTSSVESRRYLLSLAEKYPNSQYVAQRIHELKTLYLGRDNGKADIEQYPSSLSHFLYQQDKVRFFVSAGSWIQNMRGVDLSIGARLHGNVAAVLGGAPVLFIPIDGRMNELIEYHKFPQVSQDDIKAGTDLQSIVDKTDMQSHLRVQERNFEHFVGFLKTNSLGNIYDNDIDRKTAPYDLKASNKNIQVTSVIHCSKEEAMKRLITYSDKAINYERYKNRKLSKTMRSYKSRLNRKSVRLALRTANALGKLNPSNWHTDSDE